MAGIASVISVTEPDLEFSAGQPYFWDSAPPLTSQVYDEVPLIEDLSLFVAKEM